jgi:predicted ATPase
MTTDHLFVITGGPGSGKSSLIAELAARGVTTMQEAGRAIIRDQVAIGGDALPWADREGFAAQMLGWELRSHREALTLTGPVVLDRGIPDVIGYLRLCGLPAPAHAARAAAAFRYNRTVFIAPHWPEIYAQDAERKQGEAEAAATHDMMARVYVELGYRLAELPRVELSSRVEFILAHIT